MNLHMLSKKLKTSYLIVCTWIDWLMFISAMYKNKGKKNQLYSITGKVYDVYPFYKKKKTN